MKDLSVAIITLEDLNFWLLKGEQCSARLDKLRETSRYRELAALIDPLTAAIAVAAAILLFRWGANSTWLIAGGAVAGLLQAVL